MPATLTKGTRAVATVIFTDDTGTQGDPDTVVGKVRNPDTDEIATYTYGTDGELTRAAAGEYQLEFSLTVAGGWIVGLYGTGAIEAAVEDTITVPPSLFG